MWVDRTPPGETQVTNKISEYKATDVIAPPKGSSGGAPTADKQTAVTGAAGTVPQAADHVTLTGSARTLQKLSDAVASAPVVDAAKVAAVKQAIQGGTYKVDAGRVADKLLQFERGLK